MTSERSPDAHSPGAKSAGYPVTVNRMTETLEGVGVFVAEPKQGGAI